jgi:serine/threonine protein kinase
MTFDVADFTLVPNLTTTCLRTALGLDTLNNQENMPPSSASTFSKPITSYVETTGRFSDLVMAADKFPREKQIGRGAFGTVYESTDPATGDRVALKVVRYDISDLEKRMFDREVEILASVKHDTLLSLRGFMPFSQASSGNPPVIVTEFMAGGSLQALLSEARHGRVHEEWNDTGKWIVVYGTAVGMLTLHANGIMHRDLKPDNVLLDAHLLPKVGDFGLGKFVAASSQRQTFDGGTPGFIAPEVYDGVCSFAADVFSFGMLVYVTLTNSRPFAENSPFVISQKVRRGDRPAIPFEISRAYRHLIESCWDPCPEKRPTFEAVVAALEAPDFWTSSIDIRTMSRYQARHIPERAKTPIYRHVFAGHEQELDAVISEATKQWSCRGAEITSLALSMYPPSILRARLDTLVEAHELTGEYVMSVQGFLGTNIWIYLLRIQSACKRTVPDMLAWLRDNRQSQDIVGGFRAFLAETMKQQEEVAITTIPGMIEETFHSDSFQEVWKSMVVNLRGCGHPKLSLPDSELYPVVTADSFRRHVP